MKSIFLSLFLSFFALSSLSQAGIFQGNEGAEGGDDVGIEFQIIARRTLMSIQVKYPEIAGLIPTEEYLAMLKIMKVVVVEQPLNIGSNNALQESVAVNVVANKVIYINRSRWNAIFDGRVKSGIALHEVLSLLKIEGTGNYSVSALYMTRLGSDVSIFYPQVDAPKLRYQLRCKTSFQLSFIADIETGGKFTAELRAVDSYAEKKVQDFARSLYLKDAEKFIGFIYEQDSFGVAGRNLRNDYCIFDPKGPARIACQNFGKTAELKFITNTGVILPVPVGWRTALLYQSATVGEALSFDVKVGSTSTSKIESFSFDFYPRNCGG